MSQPGPLVWWRFPSYWPPKPFCPYFNSTVSTGLWWHICYQDANTSALVKYVMLSCIEKYSTAELFGSILGLVGSLSPVLDSKFQEAHTLLNQKLRELTERPPLVSRGGDEFLSEWGLEEYLPFWGINISIYLAGRKHEGRCPSLCGLSMEADRLGIQYLRWELRCQVLDL